MPQHILTDLKIENDLTVANLVMPSTPVATTLNGTLTLTNASNTVVYLTGSATGFSVVLPDATTLPQGHKYEIYNLSTQTILVKTSGGATLFVQSQTSTSYLYLLTNVVAVGTWSSWQLISDPSVASGIINYKSTSSTLFTTGLLAYTLITGFTITPQAGTYAIWFNTAATSDTNNSRFACQFFKGGVAIADSIRTFKGQTSSFTTGLSTMTTSTFNGTDACDVRLSALDTGNISVTDRTMILIRLGT